MCKWLIVMLKVIVMSTYYFAPTTQKDEVSDKAADWKRFVVMMSSVLTNVSQYPMYFTTTKKSYLTDRCNNNNPVLPMLTPAVTMIAGDSNQCLLPFIRTLLLQITYRRCRRRCRKIWFSCFSALSLVYGCNNNNRSSIQSYTYPYKYWINF